MENDEETSNMEIKLEIKKEEDNRNTRHQYKGQELDWLKVCYIHKDGSICNKERRLQKERIKELESQLPDLPDMNDIEPTRSRLPDETTSPPTNGLHVETTENNTGNRSVSEHMEVIKAPNTEESTATTSNSISTPVSVHTSLCVETGHTQDQQSIPSASVCDKTGSLISAHTGLRVETKNTQAQPSTSVHDETHHIGDTTITSTDVEQTTAMNKLTSSTSGLHDETSHTLTESNDKIDAAQGLLLLGTDVSSADDSQDLPEPPELPLTTDPNNGDKTFVADSTGIPKLPPSATSPRKGVLNLRQIGIKRHQPVDSSHPSAIGSPPRSPNTETLVQNKPTSCKTNEDRKNQRKNSKQNKHGKPKMKETKGNKDKVSKSTIPRISAPHSKSNKGQTKTSTRRTSTSTATTATASPDQDDSNNGPEGKYSIKWTVVNGTIYYCCSYCNRKYDTLHGLNNHHAKTHLPVNCDVCNRQFSTPNSLIHHSYTHLEQSFHCDQCEKSFSFKSQLQNHVTAHTQEVKHKCDKCGKQFVRTGEYNIHMRGHSNIRIQCPLDGCDYETVDVRNLTSHKKSHTKRISVYCKICGKGFVYHKQRKRHMNRMHS